MIDAFVAHATLDEKQGLECQYIDKEWAPTLIVFVLKSRGK